MPKRGLKFRKGHDADGDGLLDEYEKQLGTDPHRTDTDNDLLTDYDEVKVFQTDPLDPDTDKDGIPDGVEVKLGLNPKGKGLLKDLFIPHEGNYYKPKALLPKRLAFHALAAVALKVVAIGFIFSFPVQAWLTPSILTAQGDKIIELTNSIRAGQSLNTLTKSDVLTQAALNKAQDMFVQQYFAHVGPDGKSVRHWLLASGYPFAVAGENLALGFNSAEEIVAAWQNSPTHNANLMDKDYSEIGVGVALGDYQGFETVLAAQFFGQPSVRAQVQEEIPQPVLETESSTDTEISQPETSTVLADKEEDALPQPEIVSPANNLITKQNSLLFNVYAAGADKVYVRKGESVLTEKNVQNDYANFTLEVSEGNYKLDIQSSRENNFSPIARLNLVVDNSGPTIDQQHSRLIYNQPSGHDEVIISATVYLSYDTASASVDVDRQILKLTPDPNERNKWSGTLFMSPDDARHAFNPIIPATITAIDNAGNVTVDSIGWQEIAPVKAAAVAEYGFIKSNQSEYVKPLFDFSSMYLRVLLILAAIALVLNIFIQVRKQHVSVIASGLAFILLISFLTII